MAKENEFKFGSATVDPNKGIKAGYDLNTNQWQITQNIDQYLKHAQLEREKQEHYGKTKHGYKKWQRFQILLLLK